MRRVLMAVVLAAWCGSLGAQEWAAVEIALQAPERLGGCAVGDLLPEREGPEIVAVSRDGSVFIAWREEEGWRSERAFQAPGELIQVAVGDFDPGRPGDEILAVGMQSGPEMDDEPGASYLVRRAGGRWEGLCVLKEPALMHAVAVRKGEAFVAGYAKAVHRLVPDGEGVAATRIADLPGAGKGAVATARGVVFTCKDGSVVRIEEEAGAWPVRLLHRRDAGRSRIGSHGERLVVSDDDGVLSLIGPGGAQVLHREGLKLRGAVIGDLLPERGGQEIATAGYERKLTLLLRSDAGWEPRLVFRDLGPLHHVAAADLDGRPGLELICCGFSGRVTVIRPSLLKL